MCSPKHWKVASTWCQRHHSSELCTFSNYGNKNEIFMKQDQLKIFVANLDFLKRVFDPKINCHICTIVWKYVFMKFKGSHINKFIPFCQNTCRRFTIILNICPAELILFMYLHHIRLTAFPWHLQKLLSQELLLMHTKRLCKASSRSHYVMYDATSEDCKN